MSTGPGDSSIAALREVFLSRIETLCEILSKAEAHFGDESFLARRLVPDMLPFGTQIAFTCDQARNFGLFCQDQPTQNFDGNITSLAKARQTLEETRAVLRAGGGDDAKLTEIKRVKLGPEFYCELPGAAYVHDLLMPNLYFHLVTAYDILRAAGMELGKKDFMRHLGPHMRKA